MKLEINLVKSPQIDSRTVKFLTRARFSVASESEVMDAIQKFIKDNISTFTASLTNARLVAQLESLSNLTVSQFQGLRYMLSQSGMDIWAWAVKENEIDEIELPDNTVEYNVIDRNQVSFGFIPMSLRFTQLSSEISLSSVYQKIKDAYGIFEGSFYAGMRDPIKNSISTMQESEKVLGVAPQSSSTYVNSILDFLGKELRVISN